MLSTLTSNFGSELDSEAIGSAPAVKFDDEKKVLMALKVAAPGTSKYVIKFFKKCLFMHQKNEVFLGLHSITSIILAEVALLNVSFATIS